MPAPTSPSDLLTNSRSDRVKAVRALSRRSVREKTARFLAEGPQAVREVVAHRPDQVVDLYVTPQAMNRHTDIVEGARRAGLSVHQVSEEVLAAMGDTQAPQGLAAVCRLPTTTLGDVLAARPRLVVVLTHVRDPGNAGTVIRGADAAGADASVDVFGPKVVRSTAGSLFHLPVVTGLSIEPTFAALRAGGVRLLAADGAGTVLLPDSDLSGAHAWVMGNEAWGLDEATRAACDEVVRVPIYGKAESLNLAMAATVCLYASADAHRRSSDRP